MNFDLNKRPLSDTVKRHGSSKIFLAAIILNLVYVGISFIYSVISTIFSISDMRIFEEFTGVEIGTGYTAVASFFSVAVSAATTVLGIISFVGLLKVYSYCNGNAASTGGLDLFVKMTRVSYIVSGAIAGGLIFFLLATLVMTDFVYFFFAFLFFFAPLIGGVTVLIVFHYRAIKSTVEYAKYAMHDIACGKVSVFLIVMTIIGIAGSGINLLTMTTYSSFTFDSTGTIAVRGFLSWNTILQMLTNSLQLISNIFFLVIIFKFKSDMEIAKGEWKFIQQRKAVMESYERARAAQEARAKAEAEAAATVTDNFESEISPKTEQITHKFEEYPEDKEFFTEPIPDINDDLQIFTDDINFN